MLKRRIDISATPLRDMNHITKRRYVLHEPEDSTEAPWDGQSLVEDIAEEDVVRSVLA